MTVASVAIAAVAIVAGTAAIAVVGVKAIAAAMIVAAMTIIVAVDMAVIVVNRALVAAAGTGKGRVVAVKDIVEGRVTESMKPKEVHTMRPEYAAPYKSTNFSTNLRNLHAAIKVDQGKAASDAAALEHDRNLHPVAAFTSKGYPRWEGSDAERLLKEDFDAGLDENKEPKVLHQTRPEYEGFPLKVFRDHIHQERRSRTGRSYWMNRKANENKK